MRRALPNRRRGSCTTEYSGGICGDEASVADASVERVDECVVGRVVRANGDDMTGVGAIVGGRLKPILTVRAQHQHGLTVLQVVEALEEVDATERDPLSGATVMAGVGDGREQPTQERARGGIAQAG